jgi:hypothetical protein
LQSHSLDNPFSPETLSVLKPGMFVGAKNLDDCHSVGPTNFPVVISQQANFLRIPHATFEKMWAESLTLSKQVELSIFEKFQVSQMLCL